LALAIPDSAREQKAARVPWWAHHDPALFCRQPSILAKLETELADEERNCFVIIPDEKGSQAQALRHGKWSNHSL
jgi:hypothetical protein